MKTACLLLVLTSLLMGTPVMSPDGVPVSVLDPGLGRLVYAVPGSTWEVWWNDNEGNVAPGVRGDFDFNDLVNQVVFGGEVVNGQVEAVASFVGSAAGDYNVALFSGGQFLSRLQQVPVTFIVASEAEVKLSMQDMSHGFGVYWTGPAVRNHDNAIHAWVGDTSTPEPASSSYLMFGLLLLLGGVAKKLAKGRYEAREERLR